MPAPGTAPSVPATAGSFRAIGTEPFWGLMIDGSGLRFTTPDDTTGIRFPPLASSFAGDTLHWVGETERAAIEARIWPSRCSDGMSDKVWKYTAAVRIDGTVYRGCAEPSAGTSSLNPLGEWVVVDHRIPGISAMDDAEAVGWHGRRVRFGVEEAASGTVTCRWPDYRHRRAPADSILADFRITPAQLGLDTPDMRLGLTEVFCGDTRWTAMGAILIWVAEDRPFAPWDGVFFELRRVGA